jgi:hypothetical protein
MTTGVRVAIGCGSAFLILIILVVSQYMSAASYGNKAEVRLEAVWEDNENIYSAMATTITEMAQVPAMQAADIKDIVTATLDARYGEDGSKAAFQWIKEQNPSVDPALYSKLQQVIEAKRTEFKVAQTRLIDVKRQYKVELGGPWSGIWMRMSGYPQLNVGFPRGTQDDFGAVTSGKAKKAFETGVDEGLNLR